MGPLNGVKIIELSGIGPGPMCAMLLADLGADVLRLDRTSEVDLGSKRELRYNLVLRNREAIGIDLKQAGAAEFVLDLVKSADALIDPFRPGVLERLGIGPETCHERNPRLVFGRMTGWGQTGPLAAVAGHDLNYVALSGALNAIGRDGQPPTPPLNLVGDYGGGALYLALGMVSAILESRTSGLGQVVDAAMYEGAASLSTLFYGLHAAGTWQPRGNNHIDSGAPYYDVYECSDGKWLAIGAIEERFYREMVELLGLDRGAMPDRNDRARWPELRQTIAARVATRTRDEWAAVFDRSDACVTPVLDFDEAPQHPQAVAREAFIEIDGVVQPAPAPRFSRSVPPKPSAPKAALNADAAASLAGWMTPENVARWQSRGLLNPVK